MISQKKSLHQEHFPGNRMQIIEDLQYQVACSQNKMHAPKQTKQIDRQICDIYI